MKKLKVGVLAVLLLSGCADLKPGNEPVAMDITPQVAAKTALYAMMSANVYKNNEADMKFPLNKIGWKWEYLQSDDPTGLAFGVIRNNQGEALFVIRGTNDVADWAKGNFSIGSYSPQYTAARKMADTYLLNHPGAKITAFAGHSLGGAIALYLSASYGYPAYAFDASPRIFEAERLQLKPAERTLVFQEGEVMQEARKSVSRDWVRLVDASYRNTSKFEGCKDAICLHSSEKLAFALLKNADKESSPGLQEICKALPECQ